MKISEKITEMDRRKYLEELSIEKLEEIKADLLDVIRKKEEMDIACYDQRIDAAQTAEEREKYKFYKIFCKEQILNIEHDVQYIDKLLFSRRLHDDVGEVIVDLTERTEKLVQKLTDEEKKDIESTAVCTVGDNLRMELYNKFRDWSLAVAGNRPHYAYGYKIMYDRYKRVKNIYDKTNNLPKSD